MGQTRLFTLFLFCSDTLDKLKTGVSIEIVEGVRFFPIKGSCSIALVADYF